ncbi:hypothetical protein CMK22_20050 [Candidatus Poribacteria bacterium]|nr:hypothetical protein [Candidatus Poribacteria bacterium]
MAKNTDRKFVYKWWFFPVPFAIYFFGKMVFQFCKMDPKVYRIAEWRKALDQTGYDITEGKWDLLINKLWENSRDSKFYLDMDLQVATLLIITVFFTFAFAQWYYTSKHFIKTNEIRISLLLSESQAKSDVISNN